MGTGASNRAPGYSGTKNRRYSSLEYYYDTVDKPAELIKHGFCALESADRPTDVPRVIGNWRFSFIFDEKLTRRSCSCKVHNGMSDSLMLVNQLQRILSSEAIMYPDWHGM